MKNDSPTHVTGVGAILYPWGALRLGNRGVPGWFRLNQVGGDMGQAKVRGSKEDRIKEAQELEAQIRCKVAGHNIKVREQAVEARAKVLAMMGPMLKTGVREIVSPSGSISERHASMIRRAKTNTNKGVFNGDCNRTQCQEPGAVWYNHSTTKYYCQACAVMLNQANREDAYRLYGHDLCTHGERVVVNKEQEVK